MESDGFLSSLNVNAQCKVYRVGLWQCPQFLFIVMGFMVIVAILATHAVAELYADPSVEIVIVCVVTAVLMIISHAVVNSFDRIAEASRLKSEFISIVSHELRSPLSSIKWQINNISDGKVAVTDEEKKKTLSTIGEQNERMIRMINDLLDVSRIEDGILSL